MLERMEPPIRALEARPEAQAAAAPWSSTPRPVGTVLKRRRWTVGLALFASVGLIGGFTALQSPEYTSAATILVEGVRDGQLGAPLDVLGRVGSVSPVQTEAEMIRSRRVLEPVVDLMDLHLTVTWDGDAGPSVGSLCLISRHLSRGAGRRPFWLRRGEGGSVGLFSESAARFRSPWQTRATR